MKIESVLNVTCSKAINKEGVPADCNLLDELLSNKYQQQQDAVRNESDPVKQNELKIKMPALWPSCLLVGGSTSKNIANHTGLIVVDIDAKDNEHLTNFYDLKNEICKIPNIAYCGLSVRGKGYFLIIPITYPDKHKEHYQYIVNHFKQHGLNVDPVCKNINRLRFYSYDAAAYYNHVARPLQAYYKPPAAKPTQYQQKDKRGLQLAENVYDKAAAWVINKGYQFTAGQKHCYIFYLCSYLRSQGVNRQDAESWIDSNLMPLNVITSNCIDYPYTNYTAGKEMHHMEANKQQPLLHPVKVLAPVLPSIAPTQPILLNDQLPTIQRPGTYTLKQLQAMAWQHFSKYPMFKDKEAAKVNYFTAWANDMAAFIKAAGG